MLAISDEDQQYWLYDLGSKVKAALHKLPGKSSLNFRSVCPVCPVSPGCPGFPVCPDDYDEHEDPDGHDDHDDHDYNDNHGHGTMMTN